MERFKEKLEDLKLNNQYRQIPDVQTKFGDKILINNKEYVNFASNDYLGIGTDRELQTEFLSNYDNNFPLFSSASARLLSGSSEEFKELEATLAKLFDKEASLIYNTGYQCNLGIISALIEQNDVVFSDKLNHASIIDGMKLSAGNFIRYKHNDYNHLENLLKNKRNTYKRALIISEAVFSMDGDTADIDKLIELKQKYNCLLMIDEAHSFGTTGSSFTGLSQGKDVDIITATFGKALGSFGAFCVSNNDIINYLINKSRSFIFSTSIPPINIAWTNWLLTNKRDYLIKQKLKLNNITNLVHSILEQNTVSNSHIIPILIGDNKKTEKIAELLKSQGYYIPAIRPPTVPEGTSRVRMSLTSNTNIKDVENVLEIVKTVL